MRREKKGINEIKPNPFQARAFFDEAKIKQLMDSIKKNGLLENILVRPKENYFEIVHGERRWLACKRLGIKELEVNIRELSNNEAFDLSLIENIQRENLLPYEEALAYKEYITLEMTHKEIAKKFSKTRSYISQKLRLLKLPITVEGLLKKGLLSEGHCRQLLRLDDIIGRHENLKKANSNLIIPLNIGKYPFKNWVGFYQDFFAWHVTIGEGLSVGELKERIDKFYFNICSALIIRIEPKHCYQLDKDELKKIHKLVIKDQKKEPMTRHEANIFCNWFEDLLIERFGLSKETLEHKDFEFFNNWCIKHNLWHSDEEEELEQEEEKA